MTSGTFEQQLVIEFGPSAMTKLRKIAQRLGIRGPEEVVYVALDFLDDLASLIETNGGYLDILDETPIDSGKPAKYQRYQFGEHSSDSSDPGVPRAA